MPQSVNRISKIIELRDQNLQVAAIAEQMECSERTVRRLLNEGSRAEQRIVEFESKWRQRVVPKIDDFVPSQGNPTREELLTELVCVDLEYRWRRRHLCEEADTSTGLGPTPQIDRYAKRFPELMDQGEIPLPLILEEYRVRCKWDAEPNRQEYQERFPRQWDVLAGELDRVDDDLAREQRMDELEEALSDQMPESGMRPTLNAPAVEPAAPTTKSSSDKYTSRKEPKKGGMAVVWRAFDASLNREVAYKTLRTDKVADRDYLTMFLHEAQVTGQLEHPNIVPVYELGGEAEEDGPFYTMKYVRGGTLTEAIDQYHERRRSGKNDRRDLDRLLNIFSDVCHAIRYAHSRGVLHRDLKPDNVMVGDYGEVLVADWGLAKVLGVSEDDVPAVQLSRAEKTFTKAGERKGTPDYWAPEQAEGRADLVDCRTDVYGLGGILFQILTGDAPNAKRNSDSSRVGIAEVSDPHDIESSAPKALSAICLKALSHARSDRYARVDELIADIESYRVDEPVIAYKETLPERTVRQLRRNMVASVIAAVGIFVVILFLVTMHYTGKENRKELVNLEISKLSQFASSQEAKLMTQVDVLNSDVDFLSTLDQVQAVLVAFQGARSPKKDLSPENQASLGDPGDPRQELETIFEHFLDMRPEYMQVRLIRKDGWELARVQRDRPNGKVIVVPHEDLQDKGGRNYVSETLTKRQGEWYLSNIELNQENGVKDKDLPVIRGAVPVYLPDSMLLGDAAEDQTSDSNLRVTQSLSGIVVINLHFRELVSDLKDFEERSTSGLVYLTDSEGRFLFHPNDDIAFAFERGLSYRIQQLYKPLNQAYEMDLKHQVELDATPQPALFVKPNPDYVRNRRHSNSLKQRMETALISIAIDQEGIQWQVGDEGDAIVCGASEAQLKQISDELNGALPVRVDTARLGVGMDGDGQAVHYNRLNLEPGNEQHALGLTLVVPHQTLQSSSDVTRDIYRVALALLAMGMIALVYFAMKSPRAALIGRKPA